jgi:hypothetical protein
LELGGAAHRRRGDAERLEHQLAHGVVIRLVGDLFDQFAEQHVVAVAVAKCRAGVVAEGGCQGQLGRQMPVVRSAAEVDVLLRGKAGTVLQQVAHGDGGEPLVGGRHRRCPLVGKRRVEVDLALSGQHEHGHRRDHLRHAGHPERGVCPQW